MIRGLQSQTLGFSNLLILDTQYTPRLAPLTPGTVHPGDLASLSLAAREGEAGVFGARSS